MRKLGAGRALLGLSSIALGAIVFLSFGHRAPLENPDVLIVSVESLRWDHVGASGYERDTTPHIDRLIERGTVFRRSYAQTSWTRPSIASTFTATYPSTHLTARALDDGSTSELRRKLVDGFVTLAEVFEDQGYRTFGSTANPQLSIQLGFGQGFSDYLGLYDDLFQPKLIDLLEGDDEQPFLAWVHYVRPHYPYDSVEEYQVFDGPGEGLKIDADTWNEINQGLLEFTDSDIEYNLTRYDAAIRQTDARIGELFEALEKQGRLESTLIVLMADHGEEFVDHGLVGHGPALYEEIVRVPLAMAGPGVPSGLSVETPVQNIDVLPTLMSLLWGERLPGAQGRDLTPYFEASWNPISMIQRRRLRAPVFTESRFKQAVVEGRWKLIATVGSDEAALFDLENDPLERQDLSGDPAHRETVRKLRDRLEAFRAENLELSANYSATMGPDEEDLSKLKKELGALGYIDPDPPSRESPEAGDED